MGLIYPAPTNLKSIGPATLAKTLHSVKFWPILRLDSGNINPIPLSYFGVKFGAEYNILRFTMLTFLNGNRPLNFHSDKSAAC